KLNQVADKEGRYADHVYNHADGGEDLAPDVREPEPDHRAQAAEAVARLRRFLPQRLFTAIWVHYAEGRSLVEVGVKLGVSKHRARNFVLAAQANARRAVKDRTVCHMTDDE